MDFEDEINHLAGETLALSLLLSAVLKGMSDADPVQSGPVIWTAFEKAFRVLDVSVEKYGDRSPVHLKNAFQTLEQIREGVFPTKAPGSK